MGAAVESCLTARVSNGRPVSLFHRPQSKSAGAKKQELPRSKKARKQESSDDEDEDDDDEDEDTPKRQTRRRAAAKVR